MIKENRIIFGCGTVVVGSSILPSTITFQATTTQHIVGELVEVEADKTGNIVAIPLDLDSDRELSHKLLRVEKREIDSFFFGGYTFDFSCYNPESIRVIREHARVAMINYLTALAC